MVRLVAVLLSASHILASATTLVSYNDGSSVTDTSDYGRFVQETLESATAFSKFRSHPVEVGTLEHVTPGQGEGALIVLRQSHPEYLANATLKAAFERADRVGTPNTAEYAEFSIPMAPTTVRYIKQVGDMESVFGPLDGMRVAEIGVGYGGLSHALFSRFRLEGYTYVDLPMVERLAKKFISTTQGQGVADRTHQFNSQGGSGQTHDLCISNYALSELMPSTADEYLKSVIPHCTRGYVTWNRDQGLNWDVFQPKLAAALGTDAFDIAPEVPQTSRGNFVLLWDKSAPGLATVADKKAWVELMEREKVADRKRRHTPAYALRGRVPLEA